MNELPENLTIKMMEERKRLEREHQARIDAERRAWEASSHILSPPPPPSPVGLDAIPNLTKAMADIRRAPDPDRATADMLTRLGDGDKVGRRRRVR